MNTSIDLMEFIIIENNFQFNQTFYLQICGPAMGINTASSYRNIYLDIFNKGACGTNDSRSITLGLNN